MVTAVAILALLAVGLAAYAVFKTRAPEPEPASTQTLDINKILRLVALFA